MLEGSSYIRTDYLGIENGYHIPTVKEAIEILKKFPEDYYVDIWATEWAGVDIYRATGEFTRQGHQYTKIEFIENLSEVE